MAGETDLSVLLANMNPVLHAESYVFISLPEANYGDRADLKPIAMVREAEGMTLVVPHEQAVHAGLPFENTYACISLEVHSSLDAVGLTAAFSTRLAEVGVSANVIAGFYHDHIFVPFDRRLDALTALNNTT